jgi:HD-GYP domain-containing protein (c-di-GMP phosphodiesterase class II)
MEQIRWPAAFLAVTDAFDAMTNNRATEAPLTEREAINELERNAAPV